MTEPTQKPASRNQQSAVRNPKSAIQNPQCATPAPLAPLWDVVFGQWLALIVSRYRGLNADWQEAFEMAGTAMAIVQSTEDAREGPRAFVEGRPPKFVGR